MTNPSCKCGCGRQVTSRSNTYLKGHHFRKPLAERFWSFVRKGKVGCWNWIGSLDKLGYGKFGQVGLAHRASWMLNRGKIPNGLLVCHKCDNPSCVRPSHLFLGTDADNVKDRDKKGRQAKGRRLPNAKLSKRLVRYVRSESERGVSRKSLSLELGISPSVISNIVHRKAWCHVT
jgi:hypothetical protein